MTISYDWHIVQLDYEVKDKYVFTAHWAVTATDSVDSSCSAEAYGTVYLERPENLIPYESLSEEMVIGWVKDKLGEVPEPKDPEVGPQKSQLQELEEGLASQIEWEKGPKRGSGMPWLKAEPLPPAED